MQTNVKGWFEIINLTQTCTNQIIQVVCPGPSQSQIQRIFGVKLSTSQNMTSSQQKAKTINEQFDRQITIIFSVMNVSKIG